MIKVSVLGFVVGFLVGLTGMGGGALMTPLLILLGWARPVVAVGTDLLWGTLTKATGAFVHCRQGTVDYTIVKRLALGSVPGAILGLVVLAYLRTRGLESMNGIVVRMLAVALMSVALSLLVGCFARSSTTQPGPLSQLGCSPLADISSGCRRGVLG
jgi:uncharacterized protein